MRKRPAMEPERPPMMACFWVLPLLLTVAPAVADGVDALSCVFDAGASEVAVLGVVLLVTRVGKGPAETKLLESGDREDGGIVGEELVQDVVASFVEETGAYVGEMSVVNCTVTNVV